jgi:Gpi18-like mannosyltransferase
MPTKKANDKKTASFRINLKERWIPFLRDIPYLDVLIVFTGTLLALILRYSLRTIATTDFEYFFSQWYAKIQTEGFRALGGNFSNYPPLYLYFLYIVSVIFPHVAPVTAVKLPSIASDLICAWYVYRIVRLKYEKGPIPLFAFIAVLFAPTVVLNGAAWGQIDGIYTAALVAFLFYLLKKQNWLACITFGIAFSIKLQAIYLTPFLLVLLLKKVVSWKHLLTIPVFYLVSIIPAWIAGRPFLELITIYFGQVEGYAGLVHNAPNMYTWFPVEWYEQLYPAGVIFAVSICLIYVAVSLKSRLRMSKHLIVQLAFISALIVPYFLPKTHDRYFYPSDVLSIIFGFFFPGYYYIPLACNLISFFIYQPYLFGTDIFPQPVLALALLIVIIVVVRHMLLTLYKAGAEPPE